MGNIDGCGMAPDETPGEHDGCDCCGSCGSCETPVTASCQACGMPMTKPEEFGGGNQENEYCVYCTCPDGSLKSYDEALEGMTGFMMKTQNIGRETAGEAAREYMAKMPAWRGH